MGEVKRHCRLKILDFLAERVGEPVKRLIDIRMVRFCRSTKAVDAVSMSGAPTSRSFSIATTFGGLYLPGPIGSGLIGLYDLCVVNFTPKASLDSVDIQPKGIGA